MPQITDILRMNAVKQRETSERLLQQTIHAGLVDGGHGTKLDDHPGKGLADGMSILVWTQVLEVLEL